MRGDRAHTWTGFQDARLACEECSSALIQPLAWDPLDSENWRVLVRCPECCWSRALHLTADEAHRFRNLLDEATHGLQEVADALDLQVFRESCEGFAQALRTDLIGPTDF